MTLSSTLFGTETRLKPALRAFLMVTLLRVGWSYINCYYVDAAMFFNLVPWPWPYLSWTVWAVEVALTAIQAIAGIRLARLFLLNYAPDAARYLGFSTTRPSEFQLPIPRNRSWLPTALLLSGLVILTSCGVTWIAVMLSYKRWFPFDAFMSASVSNNPLYVGLGLSALGFMFGGRYIARASGDVSTSFQVLTVQDDHWLAKRVHGLSERLGLPKPAVGVTNVINAFAMGANQKTAMVVIGKPLFDLKEDELDAIIGHELGHVLHNDVARMQFAEGFQQMLAKVVHVLTIFGAILAANAGKRGRSNQANVQLVLGTGSLVRGTVFVASELVAKGISRNREYHADAVGAQLTSPDAMARALKWVHGVADRPTPEERHYGYLMFRGSRFGNLFATHPPLEARLTALNASLPIPPAAEMTVEQAAAFAPNSSSNAWLSAASPVASPNVLDALRGALKDSAVAKATNWAKRLPWRRIGLSLFALGGFLALAPAAISYYHLDNRARHSGLAVASFATSSWDWASDRGLALKQAVVGSSEASQEDVKIARLEAEIQQLKTVSKLSSSDASQSSEVNIGAMNALQSSVDYLRNELARLHSQIGERDKTISLQQAENFPQRIANLQTEIILKSTALDAGRAKSAGLEEQIETLQLEIEGLQPSSGTAPNAGLADAQPQQPVVSGMPVFGAVATSSTGLVIVTDIDFASATDAQKGALMSCREFGGGGSCRVKGTFNNVCAAIARVSPGGKNSGYQVSTGNTSAQAEQAALNSCTRANGKACMVTRSVCPG